jgi:hypothetical protein
LLDECYQDDACSEHRGGGPLARLGRVAGGDGERGRLHPREQLRVRLRLPERGGSVHDEHAVDGGEGGQQLGALSVADEGSAEPLARPGSLVILDPDDQPIPGGARRG